MGRWHGRRERGSFLATPTIASLSPAHGSSRKTDFVRETQWCKHQRGVGGGARGFRVQASSSYPCLPAVNDFHLSFVCTLESARLERVRGRKSSSRRGFEADARRDANGTNGALNSSQRPGNDPPPQTPVINGPHLPHSSTPSSSWSVRRCCGGKELIRGSEAESENKKLSVKIQFFLFFCLIGGSCGGVVLGLSRFFNLN